MGRSVCGKPLRRWTRRYSSQRDEFYHAKQIRRPRRPELATRENRSKMEDGGWKMGDLKLASISVD
jgi:hypothetical protein